MYFLYCAVRVAASCGGVRPAAFTSPRRTIEIMPSGRTGTVPERVCSFQTVIRRTSSGPIMYLDVSMGPGGEAGAGGVAAGAGVSGTGVRIGLPACATQSAAIPSIPRKTRTPRKDVKRLTFSTTVAMVALTKSSPIELYAQQLPNWLGRWS